MAHVSTRGLSARQLRCLIVYATQMMSNCLMIHSQINTQWPWFDLSMPPKVKCNGVNWKTIYDLQCVSCKIWKDAPCRRCNLLKVMRSWFVKQCQLSWGKLILHRGLPTCVSNKLWPERACLWNIARLKTKWPVFPFNFITGQML